MTHSIAVIGGGLAGCEAALQIAHFFTPTEARIDLFEMRPETKTPAHHTGNLAELVCSNSFKSLQLETPHGCAKMMLGSSSFLLNCAQKAAVPAGASLAVDRSLFSLSVEECMRQFPHIRRITACVEQIPESYDAVVVATGPLTHSNFINFLQDQCGQKSLQFYDAIAPIVTRESLDESIIFKASRYGKGDADFLNIPLTKEEYYSFVEDLLSAEKMEPAPFEDVKYFESCLPIEVLASRGAKTLAFGPMKPVGLDDPRTGRRPYAVIQLRQEDARGACYNLVGFQTKMRYPEQERVFRKLPGLKQAEFIRLGSIHRNTYIHAPSQLHPTLEWRKRPGVFFAGQITGTEGYSEAVTTGWIAGRNCVRRLKGLELHSGDERELFGALINHITNPALDRGSQGFQPMNMNFGLVDITELSVETHRSLLRDKKAKRKWIAERSIALFQKSAIFQMSQSTPTHNPLNEWCMTSPEGARMCE